MTAIVKDLQTRAASAEMETPTAEGAQPQTHTQTQQATPPSGSTDLALNPGASAPAVDGETAEVKIAARVVAPALLDAADRGFYVARRNGQIATAASLWIAIGAIFAVWAGAGAAQIDPIIAAGAAVAAGAGLYLFLTIVLTLLLNHSLERKVNDIRRTARIGCERLRVDDAKLMSSAVGDVLSEWMHINFFARHLREASIVALWLFGAQGVITAAALIGYGVIAPLSAWAIVALVAAPLALTAGHTLTQMRSLRRHVRDVTPNDWNPTEVLAGRMVDLLTEVKELRKPARRD